MKWDDFTKEKEMYVHLWEEMKKGYGGEMREFLNKSYLVVAYHPGQIALDTGAFGIAQNNSEFRVPDKWGKDYVELATEYRKAERGPDNTFKDKLTKRITAFDVSKLSIIEHRYEIRFPTVDIDLIQQLKRSGYCDQKLTDMSKVSIRVVLKGR